MNMTKYLNTYYGTGWVYDRTTAAWVNPDGRRVIKAFIDKEWKYIFREANGASKYIDPTKAI